MSNKKQPPANAKRPVGRSNIKDRVLNTDPTKDYRWGKTNYWGETLVQGLPPWRLWTGRMMLDSDPLVQFGLNIRNAALMPAEIDIVCKKEIVYKWLVEQWQFLWTYYKDKLTSAKEFGFASMQVDWKMKNGLMVINRVKDFAPEDSKCLQESNRTVGFTVKGNKVWAPQALWTTFGSKYGSPYGKGCLRRMYPAWYEKWMEHGAQRLKQLRMIKDAYIGDIFWYPMNLDFELPDGTRVTVKDIMREIGDNRLSGAGMTLPRIFDDQGNKLTDYSPPQDVGGGSQIFEWVDGCDIKILQGADVPMEVVQASETGSGYSGRTIPFLAMLSVCNSEFGELLECVDQQILRVGAWLNWGGDVDYELHPKNLVETFSDDTQGSPMGGSALGGPASAEAPPPQPPTDTSQFSEELTQDHIRAFESEMHEKHPGLKSIWLNHKPQEKRIHIHDIQVHKEHRKKGVGSSVIKSLTDLADKHGHKISLTTASKDDHNGTTSAARLKRFYGRFGFKKNKDLSVTANMMREPNSQHSEQFAEDKYSCAMFNLPPDAAMGILSLAKIIDRDDLHEKGVELEPHVTIKYGIHTDDPTEFKQALVPDNGEPVLGPIAVGLGPVSHFEGDEYDVVKIDVSSKGLHELNRIISERVEVTDTHPDYKPHCTIAYVKPGTGQKWANELNRYPLTVRVMAFDKFIFSDSNREHYEISLNGAVQFIENTLVGGKGDSKKASDFDPEQVSKGIKVEMEHTNDPKIALEIVIDHLSENDRYYDHLEKMEKQFNEGGIPSNGNTFQLAETEGEKKVNEFLHPVAVEHIQSAKEQILALKKTLIDGLPDLTVRAEEVIRGLQGVLSENLVASNWKSTIEGLAETIEQLPEYVRETKTSGTPPETPVVISVAADGGCPGIEFPALESAVKTLRESPAMVGFDYRETAEMVRQGAFAVTGDLVEGEVKEIREVLTKAMEDGLSRDRFIDAVVDKIGEGRLSEAHLENVFRTNALSAKSDANFAAVQQPMVSDAFPYVSYAATHDARVRDHHQELEKLGLNGTNYYRIDDPTFIKFRPPWSYNCRCRWYPQTVNQAAKKGVKEAQEWVQRAESRAKAEGGTMYQYLNETAPNNPEFVSEPDFEPDPNFRR